MYLTDLASQNPQTRKCRLVLKNIRPVPQATGFNERAWVNVVLLQHREREMWNLFHLH